MTELTNKKPEGERLKKISFDREKINKLWFANALEHAGLSQNQLAKNIGMDQSALSLMLNGRRKMSVAEAAALARELNASIETVLINFGVLVSPPVKFHANIDTFINEHGELLQGKTPGLQAVDIPEDVPASCSVTRIHTRGELFDGWVLFYYQWQNVPAEAIDRICVVQIAGEDRRWLCKVTRGFETGYFTIQPFFGGAPIHAHLMSASPILWMRQ